MTLCKIMDIIKKRKIAEALHLREKKPDLNVKSESVKLTLFNY